MSLQGRIAILKMNVLGRLCFLFSLIPMPPPHKYLDDPQSLTIKFMCLCMLQQPKHSGGLAVSNFKLYYWAFRVKQLAT